MSRGRDTKRTQVGGKGGQSFPGVVEAEETLKETVRLSQRQHPVSYHHRHLFSGQKRDCLRQLQDASSNSSPSLLTQPENSAPLICQTLLSWYRSHQRSLPWRIPFKPESDSSQINAFISDRNVEVEKMNHPGQRAYQVWVSEIMLQQTQVATVQKYYEKWMRTWPTIFDLAKARLEQVHEVWSGLGYYSRATRLLESARYLVEEFDGVLPESAADLIKHVGGVGPYTAGAISSIAYGKVAPLVDGNVVRVFSRLAAWGGDPTSKVSVEFFWKMAGELVDPVHPGHWNQALMDLGATICTPKTPDCKSCPINQFCLAYAEEKAHARLSSAPFAKGGKKRSVALIDSDDGTDVGEPLCETCIVDIEDGTFSVTMYPVKVAKPGPREESVNVCIVEKAIPSATKGDGMESTSQFLVFQNPKKGLLASLWDFPMVIQSSADKEDEDGKMSEMANVEAYISSFVHISQKDEKGQVSRLPLFAKAVVHKRTELGLVNHVFSHIKRTMTVKHVLLHLDPGQDICFTLNESVESSKDANAGVIPQSIRWMSDAELIDDQSAVPKTLRKAYALLQKHAKTKSSGSRASSSQPPSKQKVRSIKSFFKPASKGGE